MCSPSPKKDSEKPPASKVTPAKKTPAKKSSKTKYTKTTTTPRRRALPKNMRLLNHDESASMATFIRENPGFEGRHTFNELPGKPTITVSAWDVAEDAPFDVVVRATRSKYIPPGEECNKYLLKLIITTTKEKGLDVKTPDFIQRLVQEMSDFTQLPEVRIVSKTFSKAHLSSIILTTM